MLRRDILRVTGAGMLASLAGCVGSAGNERPRILEETLTLATTTSTDDTGLLREINAAFEYRFGARVQTVSQGTGAAIETGRNGDADVLLVHARSLENAFLEEGYGINRRDLMFNDFVLLGPKADPANVNGKLSVTDAFESIAASEALFLSRGDDSGTHVAERTIWGETGIDPIGSWYREAGDGMGAVLYQAEQTAAYTLSDRGTYLAMRSEIDVTIHVDGPVADGPELLANPYGIVAVNPGVHEHVKYDLAMAFIGFLTSKEGQEIIAEYTVDGEPLFFPDAIAENPNFSQYVPADWRK